MITSGGKRNPAKPDLNAGTRRERRRIDQACLILLFTDATDPSQARAASERLLSDAMGRLTHPAHPPHQQASIKS
ncbi:MAG: hypothetical protein LC808_43520 [Actinobacteria bacterium]|nr:hypothetical protein [Actinomycetota bacterium]